VAVEPRDLVALCALIQCRQPRLADRLSVLWNSVGVIPISDSVRDHPELVMQKSQVLFNDRRTGDNDRRPVPRSETHIRNPSIPVTQSWGMVTDGAGDRGSASVPDPSK
jgi:hypothetical protein